MASLFIKNKITQLKQGYPVTSDKYDIAGFTLDDTLTSGVEFGTILYPTDVKGVYKTFPTGLTEEADIIKAADKIVGIAFATNVQLNTQWPGKDSVVKVEPGSIGNVLIRGDMAVPYKGVGEPKEMDPVHIVVGGTLPAGTNVGDFVSSGEAVGLSTVDLPGYRYLGITSVDGTTKVTAIRKLY